MTHLWKPGDLLERTDITRDQGYVYVLTTSTDLFNIYYARYHEPLIDVDFFRKKDLLMYTDIFRETKGPLVEIFRALKNNTCE